MVYQDATTKKILPAASFTWDTNLATTQDSFIDVFAGIANQTRLAGQTDTPEVTVITKGLVEMPCAALGAALAPGILFGPAKQSGNALENDVVVVVATEDLAVGRLARPAAAGDTAVWLNITGAVTQGGVQAIP
jgi:hypothetical protein